MPVMFLVDTRLLIRRPLTEYERVKAELADLFVE
jgi:hypothetical protein